MMNVKIIAAIILFVGLVVQFIALGHIQPILIIFIYLISGVILIYLARSQGQFELDIYLLSFSTSLLSSGVAAFYRTHLKDPHQLKSDASLFYELSSDLQSNLSLDQLRYETDGGGAVYIWREVYRFMHYLDLGIGPYIGITFNVCLVALTGVISIKIVKAIWGNDKKRLRRFTYLYSFCGIFWLYASIHLRDSFILFSTTLLLYLWVKLLVLPKLRYVVVVGMVSVVWIVSYKYMRAEYQYIPVVMAAMGMGTWVLCSRNYISRTVFALTLLISLALLLLNYSYMSSLQEDVKFGKTWGSENSLVSLGEKYVVNTPLPVRAVIGTYYLHVYPIPFWGGFQLTTIYHLLKSLNAIYLFIVMPMAIVGAINVVGLRRRTRSPPLMFALLVYVGFSMIVALTSLETRHLGGFTVALLVLAIEPDFSKYAEKKRLNNWRLVWLSIIAMVHLAWFAMKY